MNAQDYVDDTRALLGERVVFPRGGELPLDFWERDWWAELELASTDPDGTKLMRMRRAPKSMEGGVSWVKRLVVWLLRKIGC